MAFESAPAKLSSELSLGPFSKKAAEGWDLKRLYADLAIAKARATPDRQPALTAVEKERLCGLLLDYSPAEIAEQKYVTPRTVEVSFCVGIYRYVEILAKRDRNALEGWRDVAAWLTAAGYRRSQVAINWAQMPDVPALYGRQAELDQLSDWILGTSPCRMLAINGSAGIGKTSLVIELAKKVKPQFEGVIWQSLRHQPALENVLSDWLGQLPSDFNLAGPTSEWYKQIDDVMAYLRAHRCLVVLDNLESILRGGSLFGEYEPAHEPYRELLKRMGEEPHRSCVLVTSRESNREIRGSESATHPVRQFRLQGLSYEAAELILREEKLLLENDGPSSGQSDSQSVYGKKLVQQYRGNPHFLRMVAFTIHEVFDGKVGDFLKQRMTLFGEVVYILDQQYDRLSDEEKAILQQLAQQDERVPIEDLMPPHKLESINALNRRSLIEKSAAGYTLRPVVMEHVRRKLL